MNAQLVKAKVLVSSQSTWAVNSHLLFWLFFGLHLAIALYLKLVVGLDIQSHPNVGRWDWYLQSVPTVELREHPLVSIWFLHSQPPVFNLLGALMIRLFDPNHLQALQYLYMVMGALSVGMAYVICLTVSKSVKLSILVAMFVALNSSIFLYEAYILYDILTLFESTTLVFLLCLYQLSTSKWRVVYLALFVFVLVLLTLTRSFYHLVFLLPSLLLVCILAGKQWKRILLVALCCFLLPFGWYFKNYQQVDTFGASSWLGLSFWRVASAPYSDKELRELAMQGIIAPVVSEVTAFNLPSQYIKYGFDDFSENEEWGRDDLNNINIPRIAKVYQANALKLIAHNPLRYLQAVFNTFYIFCNPASLFSHVASNTSKLGPYEVFYANVLMGHYPFRALGISGSSLAILLPFTMLLYSFFLVQRCAFSWPRWVSLIRQDAPIVFTALLILYTVMISCLLEYGENFRFKLGIELPMWVFIATVLYRRYRRPPLIPVERSSNR